MTLVLTIKKQEGVKIGDDIYIRIMEAKGGAVEMAFDVKAETRVNRIKRGGFITREGFQAKTILFPESEVSNNNGKKESDEEKND